LRFERSTGHGSLDSELEFGFGGTIELFVDAGIVAVEADEGGSTVGIPFEDDRGIKRDRQQKTKLLGEDVGAEISQSKFEAPIAAVDGDLDGDESICIDRDSLGSS